MGALGQGKLWGTNVTLLARRVENRLRSRMRLHWSQNVPLSMDCGWEHLLAIIAAVRFGVFRCPQNFGLCYYPTVMVPRFRCDLVLGPCIAGEGNEETQIHKKHDA